MTNAGTVTLDVRLNDADFLKEVAKLSAKASKMLQSAVMPTQKIDFSGLDKSLKGMTKQVTSAVNETTKSVDILADTINQRISGSIENGAKTGTARAARAISQFKMPKLDVKMDEAQLNRQLNTFYARWKAIDDQRRAQARMVSEMKFKAGDDPSADAASGIARAEKKLQDLRIAANQADTQIVTLEKHIANIGKAPVGRPVEASMDRARIAAVGVGAAGAHAGRQISKGMERATKSADKLSRATGKVKSGFKKAMRLGMAMIGVRTVYLLIRKAVASVSDSLKVMARDNQVLANSLNGISQAAGTLKGAFGAAVAPLIEALIPALQKVVEWATKAFNSIAIFVGALMGKETVQIAVGSTAQFIDGLDGTAGAAEGAGKAVERYKRQLAGFDELEILEPPTSGGGGGGGGGGSGGVTGGEPIFEEVSTGLGKLEGLANKLREELMKIAKIPAFARLMASADRANAHIKKEAIRAANTVVDSWNENMPRILTSWGNIFSGLGEIGSLLGAHLFIPVIAGATGAGLRIGAALIANILKVFASLSELVEVILAPFIDSIISFWEEHGPEVEEKIMETWAIIGEGVEKVLNSIGDLFETVFGGIKEWWEEHGPEIEALLTETWEFIWEVIEPIWNWINEKAREIFGGLADFFHEMAPKVRDVLVNAMDAVWAIVKPIWEAMLRIGRLIFGELKQFWDTWGEDIERIFSNVWEAVKTVFGGALDAISTIFGIFASVFKGDWGEAWQGIKKLFTGILETLNEVWDTALDTMGIVFSLFGEDIGNVWDNIVGIFDGIIDFVTNVFQGNWAEAWQSVVDIFGNIFSGIANLVKAPINWVIDAINFLIRQLNRIKLPDFLGGYGVNIPEIPRLARGGIIEQPTLAVVGEAGREAVMPLDRNTGWMDELAQKLGDRMGGGSGHVTIPVYLGTDTLIDVIEESINRESRMRNEPVF